MVIGAMCGKVVAALLDPDGLDGRATPFIPSACDQRIAIGRQRPLTRRRVVTVSAGAPGGGAETRGGPVPASDIDLEESTTAERFVQHGVGK